jgi:hypothetical protein
MLADDGDGWVGAMESPFFLTGNSFEVFFNDLLSPG